MPSEIVIINAAATAENIRKTIVWWKIGKYFINQDNIRALSRKGMGKGTVIRMFQGEDIRVNVDYDKLVVLLPGKNKL